ncbi:unnamed protein product [Lupinus luteus]|uniref:BZIP domain-containing protein n=1 Tax=Lupinus luteus TaxID=3873 RepID=A0AAV1WFC9_LUPLU
MSVPKEYDHNFEYEDFKIRNLDKFITFKKYKLVRELRKMVDLGEKRRGDDDLAEEQPCPKKPTILKPLPIRASANVPLGSYGSSFKPWKKPCGNYINGLCVAEASRNETKPNIAPAENENNQIMENSTSNSEERLNIGFGATSGYETETGEGQVNQLGLECSFKSEMDPKLKRVISNRLSAQKSRLKRNACLADLESKAKYFKNKAEVERLKELQRKKLAAEAPLGSRLLDLGGSVQLMSNSNLNHSSLGRLAPCKNSSG